MHDRVCNSEIISTRAGISFMYRICILRTSSDLRGRRILTAQLDCKIYIDSIYVAIYTHICLCVCVCARARVCAYSQHIGLKLDRRAFEGGYIDATNCHLDGRCSLPGPSQCFDLRTYSCLPTYQANK